MSTEQTSSASNNSTQFTVTVAQQLQDAYLQWQTFDVGKNTSLVFDQSAGGSGANNWIAFNYVRDPSGRPSQILGSISTVGAAGSQGSPTTGGQIYVIDANGYIHNEYGYSVTSRDIFEGHGLFTEIDRALNAVNSSKK